MKIERVVVSGLFGRFTHDLKFKRDEQIMIMIGPNGIGKTMVLRIIDALFNRPIRSLVGIPFHEVCVQFDDSSELTARRQLDDVEDENPRMTVDLLYRDASGIQQHFKPKSRIDERELGFPPTIIEDIIPNLEQIGRAKWRDNRSGEILVLEDVVDRYGDELPISERAFTPNIPEWLQHIRKSIPVHFIATERLTHVVREDEPHFRGMQVTTGRSVRRYSDELANRMQRTLGEYGILSQSLDRTFPVRLVEESAQSDLGMTQLREKLNEVEKRRSELVEAGLLAEEQVVWGVPALEQIDESRREVLAVYAQDAKKKLSVFDDLYARIDLLKRIANSRFLHKQVTIGSDGIGIISNGTRLELEMLSSGEQHELVIICLLLFQVRDNSFILIDEPELSLHVAWQDEFLNDLDQMAKISKFKVLLATHSPQIIGDRWDLAVELKGSNG